MNCIKFSLSVIRNDDLSFNVVVVAVVFTISDSVVILLGKSFCNYEGIVQQQRLPLYIYLYMCLHNSLRDMNNLYCRFLIKNIFVGTYYQQISGLLRQKSGVKNEHFNNFNINTGIIKQSFHCASLKTGFKLINELYETGQ